MNERQAMKKGNRGGLLVGANPFGFAWMLADGVGFGGDPGAGKHNTGGKPPAPLRDLPHCLGTCPNFSLTKSTRPWVRLKSDDRSKPLHSHIQVHSLKLRSVLHVPSGELVKTLRHHERRGSTLVDDFHDSLSSHNSSHGHPCPRSALSRLRGSDLGREP